MHELKTLWKLKQVIANIAVHCAHNQSVNEAAHLPPYIFILVHQIRKLCLRRILFGAHQNECQQQAASVREA